MLERIVCAGDGVDVGAPVVVARPNGVPVQVVNGSGAWGFEFHPESSGEYEGAFGSDFKEVRMKGMWPIPPGRVTVACLPDENSSFFSDEARTATFTVADPKGWFVPTELACRDAERFRIAVDGPATAKPSSIAGRVPGVRASDVLRKPSYPGTAFKGGPFFDVFRNDRAVAQFWLIGWGGTSWHLHVKACPGSGIERL